MTDGFWGRFVTFVDDVANAFPLEWERAGRSLGVTDEAGDECSSRFSELLESVVVSVRKDCFVGISFGLCFFYDGLKSAVRSGDRTFFDRSTE